MTTSEISLDAMLELRSRRDVLADQSNRVVLDDVRLARRAQMSNGVRAFMKWFGGQRKSHGIVMTSDTMLQVQDDLRSQFSVGMYDMRYFLAIPFECRDWFCEMPWLHVAISNSNSVLSLVCERSRLPEVSLPEFALNFSIESKGIIKMMSNYHYLDVRIITEKQSVDNTGRQKILVSRDVYLTMDIRVVGGEGTFLSLLDGRNPYGFKNRSVTTAKAPTPRAKAVDLDVPKTPLLSSGKAR